MLVLFRRERESIRIGEDVTIHVSRISGRRVRLAIEAPREVCILRGEICANVNAAERGRGIEATTAR